MLSEGRKIDDEGFNVADDVVTAGINVLMHGSVSGLPLKRLHHALFTLQHRRRVRPLMGPGSE
jgi:hypothetical protein